MPAAKKTVSKNAKTTTKKVSKGDIYMCGGCGLTVIVDDECGCEDACDIMCCGEPMGIKTKAKAAK